MKNLLALVDFYRTHIQDIKNLYDSIYQKPNGDCGINPQFYVYVIVVLDLVYKVDLSNVPDSINKRMFVDLVGAVRDLWGNVPSFSKYAHFESFFKMLDLIKILFIDTSVNQSVKKEVVLMTARGGKLKAESDVEKSFCDNVKKLGGIAPKFVSPGMRGVPDRIVLLPISNKKHAEIVAKYMRFVEMKAPGKKPTAQQKRRHEQLRLLGYTVYVVDSLTGVEK